MKKIGNLYFHGSRKENKIALTFDDGPSKETKKVLDLLKKYNAKATFFIIGKRIKGREKILERIINEGHEVGNHTYEHKYLQFKSPHYVKKEILKCDEKLMKFGIETELFRFPAFKPGLISLIVCFSLGKKAIFSDVISKDWREQYYKNKGIKYNFNPDRVTNRILRKTKNGSIINLHDYLEGVGDHKTIHKVLEKSLEKLSQKNYKFVTTSELLRFK